MFIWSRASRLSRSSSGKKAGFHLSDTWEFSGPASSAGSLRCEHYPNAYMDLNLHVSILKTANERDKELKNI